MVQLAMGESIRNVDRVDKSLIVFNLCRRSLNAEWFSFVHQGRSYSLERS